MSRPNITEADYNHHDPELAQDPYSFLAKVRSSGCPLGHSKELDGFFYPTTYEGVKRVFSDYRNFSSNEGAGLPVQLVKFYPVDLDPPSQTRWRRVLNRFFTVEAAERERPRTVALANSMIDDFIERGEADFVNEFTRPFLARSMLPVIGIPSEYTQTLGVKLLWMVHNRMTDHEGWVRTYGEIGELLMGISAARRNAPRQDDLLQCLIEEEFDGRRLDDMEVYQVLILVLFGALDSSSSAMSGALYHLAQNPRDKQRLLSGKVPWETAIEEFLRFVSPIQTLRRTVVQDTELDGGKLYKGDVVLCINAAANHDPAVFEDPDKCIIDRGMKEHMAFGAGAHVCIGRHFARVIIHTCLTSMLNRVGDYKLKEGYVAEYTNSEARALKTLMVEFTTGKRLN